MPKIPQKLKENRREAILQAAVDCLAKHGLAGTSMRTIAEAVGLTKGGLYPYFENKEAILAAVVERYVGQQLELLEPREGMSPADQLTAFMESFMMAGLDPKMAATQRGFIDLWTSAGDVPAVRASIEHRFAAFLSAIAALVRRGQEEGAFRREVDPDHVAGLILAARDGMVFQHVKLRATIPLAELTGFLRRLLLDQLQPPEAPRAPSGGRRARAGADA
ncbi:MAG TPA: TetR/AcrR family transcriptional regulator [Longimicrobium sp.]|jgi:AcrR family transcriptional regulator